jgi:hypothetical protein
MCQCVNLWVPFDASDSCCFLSGPLQRNEMRIPVRRSNRFQATLCQTWGLRRPRITPLGRGFYGLVINNWARGRHHIALIAKSEAQSSQ